MPAENIALLVDFDIFEADFPEFSRHEFSALALVKGGCRNFGDHNLQIEGFLVRSLNEGQRLLHIRPLQQYAVGKCTYGNTGQRKEQSGPSHH